MVKRLQPGAPQMRRGIKIGIAVAGIVVVLPVVGIIAIVGLFVGVSQFNRDVSPVATREILLPNDGSRRKDSGVAANRVFHSEPDTVPRIGRDRMVWR